MFRRRQKKNPTTDEQDTEAATDEQDENRRPLTMTERWQRDDAIGGGLRVIKKDQPEG